MATNKSIVQVPLKDITPDANQPRKMFDSARLADLMNSIQKHGIISPLVLEDHKTGYILVDGERRYRAATELKLKEVPAVIVPAQSEVQRTIQQFHIQEQHQGWTPLEKALAVGRLAKEMGVGVEEMARILALPPRTVGTYVSFSQIIEKKVYEKEEIPLSFAARIIALRRAAKREWEKQLGKEFTPEMEADLEKAVIVRIKRGELQNAYDTTKILDSIRKDPKFITKFIDDEKMSVEKMFLETDARAARDFRNLTYAANAVNTYVSTGLAHNSMEYFSEDETALKTLKQAHSRLGEFLKQVPA